MNNVSRVLKDMVDSRLAAGIAALVTVDCEEVYKGAYGYADLETKKPFADDTICQIYSMTKIFTAVASMILFERGLITPDDPVKKFLPTFGNMRVAYKKPDGTVGESPARKDITIRNLLTMTVGLPYVGLPGQLANHIYAYMFDINKRMHQDNANGNYWNTQKFVNELANVPMMFEPGEAWTYGLSADIMGAVIEVVSGRTLAGFMEEEIFRPLGLKDTSFTVDNDKKDRLATVYDHTSGEIKPHVSRWMPLNSTPGLYSGGEGLYSTLNDYSRFLQMLANGGTLDGVRLLGRKTIENMTCNHVPFELLKQSKAKYFADDDYGYGYLVSVKTDNTITKCWETIGSYWWGGALGTIAKVDPVEKMATVIMLQRFLAPQEQYVGRVMQAVYSLI